jgi:hypothetical protein
MIQLFPLGKQEMCIPKPKTTPCAFKYNYFHFKLQNIQIFLYFKCHQFITKGKYTTLRVILYDLCMYVCAICVG